MQNLSAGMIQAKNALSDPSAWVLMGQVEYAPGQYQRFAANATEDIIWNGSEWIALPVKIESIKERSGEIPQLTIRVCNITRQVQAQLEIYHGTVDSKIELYVVNTGDITETEKLPTFKFQITGCRCDAEWAYFTVGHAIMTMRAGDPKDRMLKNFCRYEFPNNRDPRCPYTGPLLHCNRTLSDCETRNGSDVLKFGGFPAIGLNKIYE